MKQDPRPTPIADSVQRIMRWYEERSGQNTSLATRGRVLEILLYLERTGLQLEACQLHVATDERWHERGNRTDHELLAAPIGRTSTRQKRPQYWYILPASPSGAVSGGPS